MNRQIVKLFALIVVLFAVLIGFTSYWSVFDAEALKEKDANKRPLLEQQQIRARPHPRRRRHRDRPLGRRRASGDALRYVRRYPEGSLYGHPIGYSFVAAGRQRVRAVPQRRAGRRGARNSPRSSTSCAAARRRATTSSPTSTRRRSGSRSTTSQPQGFGAVVAIEPQQRPGAGAGLEPALRPQPRALRTRRS